GHTEDPDDLLMAAAERGVARASAGSWGAAAVLAALAISPAPAGADPVTKSIRVASTPPGSWICFKQRGAFECDARTPAAIEVEFYDEDDVKTLYLRRPGYEPFTRKITRDTASLAPALARAADLYRGFPDTPQAAKVRRALDGLLYGGNAPPIDHPYIDLVPGSLRLVDIDGKDYLHVSLLAGRAFSDRELRKLYRLRNREEFKAKLAATFIDRVLADLIRAVHAVNEKRALGLEGVSVSVTYPKHRARLVDDEYQLRRANVGTWQLGTTRYTSIT